jgi:hypothetical protein
MIYTKIHNHVTEVMLFSLLICGSRIAVCRNPQPCDGGYAIFIVNLFDSRLAYIPVSSTMHVTLLYVYNKLHEVGSRMCKRIIMLAVELVYA